ncbi:hypothetical protein KIH79_01095 [Bifidobacterium sp. 82T10]|uniref:Uncharacterized protein n=1 Tax=Bifidobacterium miconis TaxID=2834435 RepID=A0ABS6WBZ5_9BIFI|nr:hypothetical protein [Bifidobacterium miconis]MBW3091568.1 hypothetical protein [Bifidobacterium miconis]
MSMFDQTSAFGGAPSTFGADYVCSCHGIVAASQSLVHARVAQTRLAADDTATPQARSMTMPWEGNAASLFRQRLADCASAAQRALDDAEATLRIAGAGA